MCILLLTAYYFFKNLFSLLTCFPQYIFVGIGIHPSPFVPPVSFFCVITIVYSSLVKVGS